jgi:hypothetical protein
VGSRVKEEMSAPVTTARIELRLRELAQLFNSMDPSPFIDRDLDADAEEFIVSWVRELQTPAELELVIHVATPPPPDRAVGVGDAVRHYFQSRAEIRCREFRMLMKRGRVSLAVGLLFLAICFLLSEVIAKLGYGTTAEILRESLTIGGWVAMWRPLEIYLYDWWPLRNEQRTLERLARMQVRLVMPEGQKS